MYQIKIDGSIYPIMNPHWIKEIKRFGKTMTLNSTKADAIGVNFNGVIYHIDGKPEFESIEAETVELTVVDESAVPTDLELAKKIKTDKLNVDAETTIHKGQNVTLSTGTEFFSFTLNDQSNITGLYSDLLVVTQGGESLMGIINKDGNILVPYHADEYICNYYSAQDWVSLVQQMGQFKLYNLTYVNIAKIYIKSLNDIDKVNAFKYGDALPKSYNDHLLYITSGGKKGKLMDE